MMLAALLFFIGLSVILFVALCFNAANKEGQLNSLVVKYNEAITARDTAEAVRDVLADTVMAYETLTMEQGAEIARLKLGATPVWCANSNCWRAPVSGSSQCRVHEIAGRTELLGQDQVLIYSD